MIMNIIIKNKTVIIDDENLEVLNNGKWGVTRSNYVYRNGNADNGRRVILLHRLLIKAKKGQTVDHINGNPLDNRIANLRICTQSQNIQNSRKKRGCSSNYKGVWWSKNAKKWQAAITPPGGRQRGIGYYNSEIEAAKAYNAEAEKLFGEFALLNIIPLSP